MNALSKKSILAAALTVTALFSPLGFAADDATQKAEEAIARALEAGKPGISVTSVEPSAIDGLYKATIGGGGYVYSTADGGHFIAGDIYQVTPGKIVNLSDQERNVDRAKTIAALDKKDTINFAPKGDVKEVMYVFTDVDCGYCQKLHSHMAEYNNLGVEVRYLAFPRAGINSESYRKIASAWCAKDPQAAMTKLKQRQKIEENVCAENPVAAHYHLGQQMGVTGTPALVFESGEMVPGYIEPDRLKQMREL